MSAPLNFKPRRGRQWAVWNKNDGMPREFFATRELAIESAAYQAHRLPGQKFHVVQFDSKLYAPRPAALRAAP
jgi:hypothetical protein